MRSKICLAGAAVIALVAQVPLAKTFHDPRTGLIIRYPSPWVVEKGSPVFDILSFPYRRRPAQVLVHMNCAEISVIGPPPKVSTMSDWMHLDRIGPDLGDSVTEIELRNAHYGIISATMVRSEVKVIPHGRTVAYYAAISGRLVKVVLFYRGAERASYFESVLLAVVNNLEFESSALQ